MLKEDEEIIFSYSEVNYNQIADIKVKSKWIMWKRLLL
jgi:hypothetical protein